MSLIWGDVLQRYREQNFIVLERDALQKSSLDRLLPDTPSVPTLRFLHSLADSRPSLWEALFSSVQTAHPDIKERDVLPSFKGLIEQASQVGILHGEHFSWKSPDKWSYLFQIQLASNPTTPSYVIIHPPATSRHMQQVEAILGCQLPPTYTRFLKLTNGLGFAVDELQYIRGVGEDRAHWEDVANFQPLKFPKHEYHEITGYWLQWQDTLAYEREVDRESGINTFLSDERTCIPFAYTNDDWCFDRSKQDPQGEYPILFWNHELREATFMDDNFESWFSNRIGALIE